MKLDPHDHTVLGSPALHSDTLIQRAVDWANINSGSRNTAGLLAVLAALEDAFATLPATIERVQTGTSSSVAADGSVSVDTYAPALKITCRPDAPLQIILTGHYDTVFAEKSPFQRVVAREDGALNGPGIADMKGGISVMLGALEAFEAHPLKDRVGWTALLSPDEEIGSPGSAPLLAQLGR
ncbi:M20/M25/M40 family metallo-hydrolase, partial [Brevundimonas sp.]